jgi:ATP-dependent exoDNAse (exonuclease V) alpha subunit
MEAVDLYHLVCAAMPHKYQEVFLGDIQQLPPVFGLAILGFKMNELPVVELTHVYRQALNSPIIDLAWKLLEGNPHEFSPLTEKATVYSERAGKDVTRIFCPTLDKLTRVGYDPEDGSFLGEVRIQVWQKRLSPDTALFTSVVQFNQWADQGYYNPQEDIILCPFNKAFGTIELNKGIAQHLGVKRGAQVHEVIAGFNKHYLAVGDRVLFDKEDAFITAIYPNGEYLGVSYQAPSVHLDRWGHLQQQRTEQEISSSKLPQLTLSFRW